MRKVIICLLLAFTISFDLLALSAQAAVPVTGTFAGISDYTYCSHKDRMGAKYVQNLNDGLITLDAAGHIDYSLLPGGMYKDSAVNIDTCLGIQRATLYAYSGHGLIYDTLNNSLHMNDQIGTFQTYHSYLPNGDKCIYVNKRTQDIAFNHKYVILYTCNQLTNSGSTTKANKIMEMLNGTRLLMGCASTMYLDSREGTNFTQQLRKYSIKDAFFASASIFQTQRDSGDAIARVIGYKPAKDDSIQSAYAYAPVAKNSMSSFGIIETRTIQHKGVLIP